MSHTRTTLSLLERLDLAFSMLKTIAAAMTTLLGAPFRGADGHPKLSKHVIHTALRIMNARISARQIHGATFRNMSASTDEAYITFAQTKDFEPISIELPEDATAHWVGSPDAEKILVVFHGGGFLYPATTQFRFLYDVLQETGPETAGVILSYSLAPGKLYPHQLKQSLALMTHLINTAGKKPENMILAGDSVGANLILGLFSHMLHPHPSIPPLEMNGPLKGAVLVSPWVNFTHAAPSYTRNRKKDMVNQYVLTRWARYYTGDAPADAYSQPGTATEQWWQRIETKVESILITAGGNEVMFDDICNFSQTLKRSFSTLEAHFMKDETHDQLFMDPVVGEKIPSDSARLIKSRVVAKL